MKQLDDRDKIAAIVHEVGHLTVALALGFPACAAVSRTDAINPVAEKMWGGRCRVNYKFRSPSNRQRSMIGLAGWLAELLHENPDADVREELCIVDLTGAFYDGLSDTDLASLTVNNRWIVKWAQEVQMLFRKHEAFRGWAMATLSKHGFISEQEAVAAFPDRRKFAKCLAHAEAMRERLADHVLRRSSDGRDE